MSSSAIESRLAETRVFSPEPDFAQKAHVGSMEAYHALYARSIDDRDGFWREEAERYHWFAAPETICSWTAPHARWFDGGRTNLAYNCLDRQVEAGRGNRAALIWEGEPGEERTLTYRQLLREVGKAAAALAALRVGAGDRVAIYMGMVPEAAIAMLACARLGAVHTVIFGGFSADAIRDRIADADAKVVLTQDGAYRRGSVVPLKANVDAALSSEHGVEHVVVLRRTQSAIDWVEGRDRDWEDLMNATAAPAPATPVDAEHPLFILYTSGTTGKPKGVLHTTGGYMVGAGLSTRLVFDLQDDDVYWCTADVGWITGHSYIVYGPMLNGATVLMYEGAPNHPDPGRFWDIVERHSVSIFYTAPTAIRAFIKWGDAHPKGRDLSSLRLLGTVGEPINPEAWMWYRDVIGGGRCPIVDTWWQTETGGIMMAPLPGAVPAKPGSCCLPMPGVVPKILREDGSEADANEGGLLAIEQPWPSMLRTVWGDDERFRKTYFGTFEGKYFTGDGARRDEDGYFWVMGRVDDVVNVSGHRLGTAEIESALVAHDAVAEAAVVGRPDALTGQALVAFVTVKGDIHGDADLRDALMDQVAREIGKFARPASIRFAPALPKTRSGKIMRRLLKALAAGETIGDVTTLEDPSVLEALKKDA